jgi:hypothetical protein
MRKVGVPLRSEEILISSGKADPNFNLVRGRLSAYGDL